MLKRIFGLKKSNPARRCCSYDNLPTSPFPMLVNNGCSIEEMSAIMFMLDNFVNTSDAENVINLSKSMMEEVEANGNFIKKCSKCHGRCRRCKQCQCKERKMLLVGNALQKLSSFAAETNAMLHTFRKTDRAPFNSHHKSGKKIVLSDESYETFDKLKVKLNNMKTFYPKVYECGEDVIEQWASYGEITKMNPKILESKDILLKEI
ncbi:hypothetical protein GWI33_007047 [Rhynchophorus ferrugineus]|uniref:Uncharacterized protein n=1 Tax=Rhynchophorus ferrugineus TaxID=354439 RepID=A0A834IJD2_RHYFE|nr:hypothetical protein GWI33_007047 [Rhynchophorus ferrugineus]